MSNDKKFESFFLDPGTPKTGLARYRVLSSRAGIRVSPIQLGGAAIGDQWEKIGFGHTSKDTSFAVLDEYFNAGGNFIDTACNYQDETSEKFIGEWAEKRGIRKQLVIATKYSTIWKRGDDIKIKVNYTGNNLKNMRTCVEESLQKLRTDYIDIFYVHWWDFNTSIEEMMDGLHRLVMSGKVLYLGISDTPAWVVAEANRYAQLTGRTPFVIYQGKWNLLERSFERDIIPMARQHGMALAPWEVLGGGKFRTDEEEKKRLESGENGRDIQGFTGSSWLRNDNQKAICAALEKVAKEVGAKSIRSVAIAYVMQKTTNVFPIIGARKADQVLSNLEALEIALSDEHIKYLESILPFDEGFPNNFVGDGTSTSHLLAPAGVEDKWPLRQPIKPAPKAEKAN